MNLPQVDRIWLWVHYNKIPIYPIFYLLQGDYKHPLFGFRSGIDREQQSTMEGYLDNESMFRSCACKLGKQVVSSSNPKQKSRVCPASLAVNPAVNACIAFQGYQIIVITAYAMWVKRSAGVTLLCVQLSLAWSKYLAQDIVNESISDSSPQHRGTHRATHNTKVARFAS